MASTLRAPNPGGHHPHRRFRVQGSGSSPCQRRARFVSCRDRDRVRVPC
jgi:hypothetical protein